MSRTRERGGCSIGSQSSRHEFAEELASTRIPFGRTAEADGTGIATVHRTWMQLKARLASNPERAIPAAAACGERELVEAQDLGVRVAGRLVADLGAR